MRWSVTSVVELLLLVAALLHCTVANLPLPSGTRDSLELVTGALDAVLATVPRQRCSVFLLTDDNDSCATIRKRLSELWAPRGVAVFQVAADGKDHNVTQEQLSRLVGQARRLRRLSWCVRVVVVSEDPAFLAAFAQWSLKGRLLLWSTRLLVVTHLPRPQLQDLISGQLTFSIMNALVITLRNSRNNFRCDIYTHLPYGPQGPHTLHIASWTPKGGLVLTTNLLLFPDKFSNFYGATVDVPATTYKPLWFDVEETGPDGIKVKKHTGMDYLLLDTIAKTLNFSFNVIPITYWSQALELTSQRKAFLTPVYHLLLYHRLEYIDFTLGFTYAFVSFTMAKPKLTPNWLGLYSPLADEVWASILGVLLLVPAFFYVMVQVRVSEDGKGTISAADIFHTTVGTLVGENLSRQLPTTTSSRVLVAGWLVFAFIMGTAYRGNLTAALTLPKYPPRPETIQELVNTVDKVTVMPWGEDFKIYFKESGSPLFERLADLMEPGIFAKEGLNDALLKNQAHMEGIHKIQLDIADHFTRIDGTSPLYIGRESFMPGLAAFPIPHDAPYKPQLDHCISTVVQAGLYDKWTEDMLDLARRDSRARQLEQQQQQQEAWVEEEERQSGSTIQALSLTHLLGPLMLLLLGLLTAGFTFIIETLVLNPQTLPKSNNKI